MSVATAANYGADEMAMQAYFAAGEKLAYELGN